MGQFGAESGRLDRGRIFRVAAQESVDSLAIIFPLVTIGIDGAVINCFIQRHMAWSCSRSSDRACAVSLMGAVACQAAHVQNPDLASVDLDQALALQLMQHPREVLRGKGQT
jgi:hypothetical protein